MKKPSGRRAVPAAHTRRRRAAAEPSAVDKLYAVAGGALVELEHWSPFSGDGLWCASLKFWRSGPNSEPWPFERMATAHAGTGPPVVVNLHCGARLGEGRVVVSRGRVSGWLSYPLARQDFVCRARGFLRKVEEVERIDRALIERLPA